MRIRLLSDLTIGDADGITRYYKAGEEASVFHPLGRRLLYRRLALWVHSEDCDPAWTPVEMMRVAVPKVDKMIRAAANK